MADPGERSARTTRVTRDSFRQELKDAQSQSAASRKILAALGRAVANPGDVLDTVLEEAARLCEAQVAQLYLLKGDVFVLSHVSGEIPEEYRKYLRDHPVLRNRLSAVGRAAVEMRTHQIRDVLNDADYGRTDLQELAGFRTMLATPMILQDELVGVLSMWRTDVKPFDARERKLLEEFAIQGAIALRQRDLMLELDSRGKELESKVDQLVALREVGEAVGQSLDLDPELLLDESVHQHQSVRGIGPVGVDPGEYFQPGPHELFDGGAADDKGVEPKNIGEFQPERGQHGSEVGERLFGLGVYTAVSG